MRKVQEETDLEVTNKDKEKRSGKQDEKKEGISGMMHT